jgi:hypothetical protein
MPVVQESGLDLPARVQRAVIRHTQVVKVEEKARERMTVKQTRRSGVEEASRLIGSKEKRNQKI